MPELSSANVSAPARTLKLGKYLIPLGQPSIAAGRKSVAFWTILGQFGIFSSILRVPITFPPEKFGGVLTVLWHDRSPGPERFWGEFYAGLVQTLKARKVWFGTAGQVVAWFRKRREVTFERREAEDGTVRIRLHGGGQPVAPPLRVRIYSGEGFDPARGTASARMVELAWDGESDLEPQPVTAPNDQDPTRPVCTHAA